VWNLKLLRKGSIAITHPSAMWLRGVYSMKEQVANSLQDVTVSCVETKDDSCGDYDTS
jgi:hypothetical protein